MKFFAVLFFSLAGVAALTAAEPPSEFKFVFGSAPIAGASLVPPPPLNAPGGDRVVLNDREFSGGPGGALVLHWDDKLTLEFNGPQPSVSALEISRVENIPTVFIAGDSTVTDQPREPGASWG